MDRTAQMNACNRLKKLSLRFFEEYRANCIFRLLQDLIEKRMHDFSLADTFHSCDEYTLTSAETVSHVVECREGIRNPFLMLFGEYLLEVRITTLDLIRKIPLRVLVERA